MYCNLVSFSYTKYIFMFCNNSFAPISLETCINLVRFRAMSTILTPRCANCFAYSFPIPSVEPVITEK